MNKKRIINGERGGGITYLSRQDNNKIKQITIKWNIFSHLERNQKKKGILLINYGARAGKYLKEFLKPQTINGGT